MALWGCPTATADAKDDPSAPGRFVTWNHGSPWRIGEQWHRTHNIHASGALHTHQQYHKSIKAKCPCGLPFWRDASEGIGRYCCAECISSVGQRHSADCSGHF